jgi:hypothetical protein
MQGMAQLEWQGTAEEAAALTQALANNCQCKYNAANVRIGDPCPAHHAFLTDQRFLNGLVFARRYADCLWRGEMCDK